MELFTQKVVTKLSKIWVWDPGSGIRDPGSGINLFRIPDPGSRGQKGPNPGSRIRIRNTGKKFRKKHVLKCWMYSFEGFFCSLDVFSGGLGKGKLYTVLEQKQLFLAVYFYVFWSSNSWIRNDIQPKMLDPDPYQMKRIRNTSSGSFTFSTEASKIFFFSFYLKFTGSQWKKMRTNLIFFLLLESHWTRDKSKQLVVKRS